jgi:hypothetical protein
MAGPRLHAKDTAALVETIRKQAGDSTHVLVGPALIYHDEQLSIHVAVGKLGQAGQVISIDLGRYEAEPEDDALCAAADTVIWLRRGGGITKREADAARQDLVAALRKLFVHVGNHNSDLALAEANARLFPSAKARQVLAQVRAENEA